MNAPGNAIVIDTNVVLDLWVFREPRCDALRDALADARLRWVATDAMRDELEHTLGRGTLAPRWQVDLAGIRTAWARQVVVLEPPARGAPFRCSDPDDQKFIDFALAVPVRWLLTRDRALLRLARHARPLGLAILTPEQFLPPTDAVAG